MCVHVYVYVCVYLSCRCYIYDEAYELGMYVCTCVCVCVCVYLSCRCYIYDEAYELGMYFTFECLCVHDFLSFLQELNSNMSFASYMIDVSCVCV
jgi:hypothetical protein